MKLSAPLHQSRRANSFRSSSAASPLDGSASADSPLLKSPSSLFWIVLHALCCLFSLFLGFRFSRLLFLLLFSPLPSPPLTQNLTQPQVLTSPPQLPSRAASHLPAPSRVVVGRHGILVRPWPHPDAAEVLRAHRIIERVQREQRLQYGAVKSPRPVIVVTPTYARTFQALHLTGLLHSLMLVPFPLTWILVDASVNSSDTAALLAGSGLNVIHLRFPRPMPVRWSDRHRAESRMRLLALREVRDRKLDGLVVFADDSNMHSLELFDEIQKVKWMGALSVGILAHSGNSEPLDQKNQVNREEEKENSPVPVQGPACNSSGQLVGWHTFNSLPYKDNSATFVGDGGVVLPAKLEWAGFVLNSRLVWKEAEGKPEWARDLDDVVGKSGEEELESPLVLVRDASFVEPLGSCGKKVMLWWLRVEARLDSKFPPGWIIDPPLEMTVPAKRTPWPDAPPELPSEKVATRHDHSEKRSSKTGRSSRSRRSSHKKKHEPRVVDTQASGVSQRIAK